jgi:hypothetical protein
MIKGEKRKISSFAPTRPKFPLNLSMEFTQFCGTVEAKRFNQISDSGEAGGSYKLAEQSENHSKIF